MENNRHKNSKRVTIYRAGSFIQDAQTGAAEFLSMSKKSIGSYFSSTLGTGVGTGLSFAEIDTLLPLVVDIPCDDRSFRKAVTDFYSSLCTKIDYGTGKELEIGLELSNEKPVTYTEKNEAGQVLKNLPINLNDYIRYRHIIKHPRVAMSRSDAAGDQLIEFYVFDPEAVTVESSLSNKLKDEALTLYLTLAKEPEKVDLMLILLLEDPRTFHGTGGGELKVQRLRELADTKPDKFVAAYKGDHLEQRYQLQAMQTMEIVKKFGSQYVEVETGAVLGHTIEEAIFWLKDEKNADKLQMMKARMQEAMKKKIGSPRRPVRTTAR